MSGNYRIRYDSFADVLYVNRVQDTPNGIKQAVTTEFDENYIAVRRLGNGEIQGITIDGYQSRQKGTKSNWDISMLTRYL